MAIMKIYILNEQNFQVSIQSWKGDHFCGGTLYDDFGNNTHVLTAAHCVMDSKKYRFDPRKVN